MRKNVILADNSKEEMESYRVGLEKATGLDWEVLVCKANGGRTGKWGNILRYGKYFLFSFWIFLNRRRYGRIVAWQEFYGLIFAFWCRVFRVDKKNVLAVKNLTYREKRGIVGEIYFRFLRYIVKSEYVDIFTCCSKRHCRFCAEIFEEPEERFRFVPFGVEDVAELVEKGNNIGNYVLSIGRSNRDWMFLIHALGDGEAPLYIVCDEFPKMALPGNMTVFRDVCGKRALEMLRDCKIVVIPILDENVASGETVLLQAMAFGKPVVVAKEGGRWEEYIVNGENGFVVPKDEDLLRKTVGELWGNREKYFRIFGNSRRYFEENGSLSAYGERVGKLLKREGLA